MKCNYCGEEASGNFCNHCGAPLPKEEAIHIEHKSSDDSAEISMDANYRPVEEIETKNEKRKIKTTVTRQKRIKKETKSIKNSGKQKSVLNTGKNVVQNSVSTAGSVAGKSVKTLSNILFMGIHCFCAVLMLFITFQFFLRFWNGRDVFGSLATITSSKNPDQIIFTGGYLFLIFFGLIQTLWILGSKKVMDMGKIKNIDTGRGLFAFVALSILIFLAPTIVPHLPGHIPGIEGAKRIASELSSSIIVMCSILGLVLSFIRKLRGSFQSVIS